MVILDVIQKNIAYQTADIVKEICSPFFSACGLSYFDYTRIFPDGSVATLVTDRNWFYHYFEKNYSATINKATSGIYLWDQLMCKAAREAFTRNFQHGKTLSIFKEQPGYIEITEFAAAPQNENALDLFFNHQDVLNQFILYFKEKASDLIIKVAKDKFFVPSSMQTLPLERPNYTELKENFLPDKISVFCGKKEIWLTLREYQCLCHLSCGRSMKEIGNVLGISPRTVETHLDHIRDKTNYTTRNKLIDLFFKNK